MENKYNSIETLEKAVLGDFDAMQEVIRLLKPYMTRLSMEDGRFNNELLKGLYGGSCLLHGKLICITVKNKQA